MGEEGTGVDWIGWERNGLFQDQRVICQIIEKVEEWRGLDWMKVEWFIFKNKFLTIGMNSDKLKFNLNWGDKMKKGNMYNIKDWSEKYKDPMTESYQPKEREYAGKQYGKTLDYINKRDRIQTEAARKVNNQEYKGRYS